MKLYRILRDLLQFMQLPLDKRRLTFYSEGKNYWPHLEGLVRGVLSSSNIHVCYISSDKNDPGLFLKHPNYKSFEIDEGFVRNWLFENIETDVMVMTMPDLHQYQVKKSKHKVHYVYVQHSMVSLHMTYRKGAFDYYNTIFCAGPHHIKEIRAIEKKYKLPKKILVEHGYARLDSIINKAKTHNVKDKVVKNNKHVLLAPSWGTNGVIETEIGKKIVDTLISHGHKVTLRPHPETIKSSKDIINIIVKKHCANPLFFYEANVDGENSLHDSDIMISDWSGAALDYAFGLDKPVLFIDVKRKVNNPDYIELNIEPIEVMIREKIGMVINVNDVDTICDKLNCNMDSYSNAHIFNIGNSDSVGSKHIIGLL